MGEAEGRRGARVPVAHLGDGPRKGAPNAVEQERARPSVRRGSGAAEEHTASAVGDRPRGAHVRAESLEVCGGHRVVVLTW